MVFPDGTTKEGIFENNVFKHELPKPLPQSQSAVHRKPSLQGDLRANIHSAHSPGQNHMRSTKASSGFQIDPYPYNSNLQSRIYKSPAANAKNHHQLSSHIA
tara:strand:+ start:707 stop:1012 length:306 start_codon:yes stop_codon:yes gene_type:complete